jgi:hypothetical protein
MWSEHTLEDARRIVRAEVAPAFAGVASRGFQLVETTGRYPRVEARRSGRVEAVIDFWMSLDERGRYRLEWTRDTPFDLGGCVAVEREEGGACYRYWKPLRSYDARPYSLALQSLAADIDAFADVLEPWTEELVVRLGSRTRIPSITPP